MISETKLKTTMQQILGSLVSDSFPFSTVAEKLTESEMNCLLDLSEYGYVMWAIDHYGHKCAYKNLMAAQRTIDGYTMDAVKYRDDMPMMLLNAHTYVNKLLANVADIDICLKQLEGMSFPYVLYVLFAASGQEDVVARYKPEIEEQLKRYPSTLDLLPASYRDVKKGVLNASTKQS